MGKFGKEIEKRKSRRVIEGVIYLFIAICLLLSLITFHPEELSFLSYPFPKDSSNLIGKIGNWAGFFIFFLLGWAGYIIVLWFLLNTVALLREDWRLERRRRVGGYLCLIISLALLASFFSFPTSSWGKIFEDKSFGGGILGYFLVRGLLPYLGTIGTPVFAFLLLIIGGILSFPLEGIHLPHFRFSIIPSRKKEKKITPRKEYKEKPTKEFVEEEKEEEEMGLPSLSLLRDPPPMQEEDDAFIKENAERLEKVLEEFGLKGEVVDVHRGPVITSYEVKPGVGVKVHQITALADDIALALQAQSLRIVSPIPGKAAVGIEIPNPVPRLVYLKEIISSQKFKDSSSKLTLALGKDIRGNPIVGNLKEMPHLLIAGTTGSGKTVCLHSLVMSLLFQAFPNEVKLLLVDPKMVELAPFSRIPHLYTPIITSGKNAAKSLQWIVEEMEERYQTLAEAGVRDVERFNKLMEKEGNEEEKIPYIVVIIDELADLMAVASRQVEDSIMRLAQLSRAAGIHLILATQRPSVDVITGVIKANFPCRISFQVSSKVDSRTILDMSGAEKLLGKGDMLYLPVGSSKPIRAQGCFVTEEEIEKVVEHWSRAGKVEHERIPLFEGEKEEEKEEELPAEDDPLFKEAVKVIFATGMASASNLQRRMRIGYARAGRLIDLMEKKGIVGPARGSKPREILVSEAYLKELEKEGKK
ncbi:DNA translocase FtsK 4TM domain-containing protein [Candidatus Calescamantes bacterium]|nr:DNA translocase FtsK 4TM domain-containing protein [Candidatus Calescamantes bacterium]